MDVIQLLDQQSFQQNCWIEFDYSKNIVYSVVVMGNALLSICNVVMFGVWHA